MIPSFLIFLALWGLVHVYNKEYSANIKLRVKSEFNKRLELFIRDCLDKYAVMDDPDDVPTFNQAFRETDSARKEFKEFVDKSRRVFAAEVILDRLDFVDKYFYYFTLLLAPSAALVVGRQFMCFGWCALLNGKYPLIKVLLIRTEGMATAILVVVLLWYMWQFFKVRTLKDGI